MSFMNLIFAFLISWIIGIFSFWIISKFSASPPPIFPDFVVGAFIVEIFYFLLKGLPWLFFWLIFGGVVWIAMIKVVNLRSPYSYFGAIFYVGIKVVISLFLMFKFLGF